MKQRQMLGYEHPETGELLTPTVDGRLISECGYVKAVRESLEPDKRKEAHERRLARKDSPAGAALPFDW